MLEDEKHPHYCRKEKELGALESKVGGLADDINTLNRIVMTGNGQPPLATSVPQLAGAVKELVPVIHDLKTGLSGFIRFQSEQEGYHKGEETAKRRSRWVIGILVTVGLGLMTTMIVLLAKM